MLVAEKGHQKDALDEGRGDIQRREEKKLSGKEFVECERGSVLSWTWAVSQWGLVNLRHFVNPL